ncbi:MAG: Ig-like domain-containing protein [Bacteroidales bacterium]|nr:Ig-like domain-containing protein [Bacteroidales bacterium]
MKRYLLPLLSAAIVLLPLMFSHSCANTTEAPSGGAKDTIPPYIVDIRPYPGATGFPIEKARIVFTFNEYVTIKNQGSIYLSPPQGKKPKSAIKGKKLIVSFEEALEPNTTYTLNLGDAIADNNEGNPFPGFTFVFSTGSQIDSMFTTGMVQDCNTLLPVKDATVMLYKNHADSAVFLERPYAAARTDDWGYFVIPFIQDTVYRIYAVVDADGNNVYDPDQDRIGFMDSLLQPKWKVADTIPELLKYDMKDTLGCEARRVEHTLGVFREKPSKQFLKNKERTGLRSAYISFQAPYVWIDSLWFGGFRADEVISQFNPSQDSLELWLNSRAPAPDTLHLFVNYRKTDSTGVLKPELEHLRLPIDPKLKRTYSRSQRRNLKHEDTVCLYKLEAKPERVEQYGFELEFSQPIISAEFDSLKFRYLNPKQKEFRAGVKVERDSLNLRRWTIRPEVKYQQGFEYFLKVPHRAFRDINGFYSDSTEVKVSLPSDEKLSSLTAVLSGVDGKYIVDLLDEGLKTILRSYTIDSDCNLAFPYLKEARYCLRITSDLNRNGVVDTGSLLERRQPELVKFVMFKDGKFLEVPPSAEITQEIDLRKLFANE